MAGAIDDPTTHPYAIGKRISLGSRVKRGVWQQRGWEDALLIPIYEIGGRVQSIEAINSEPDEKGKFPKDSLLGGKKSGGLHPFGKITGASRVFIAEGIANAAVAAEVDKSPAVAAMGKSNLPHAAKAVRELAPDAEIIIVADNDLVPPAKALEAALAVGGRVVIPDLGGPKCDLWDLWNEGGLEAAREAIASATTPGEHEPDTESEQARLRAVATFIQSGDPMKQPRPRPQTDILIDIGENASRVLFAATMTAATP